MASSLCSILLFFFFLGRLGTPGALWLWTSSWTNAASALLLLEKRFDNCCSSRALFTQLNVFLLKAQIRLSRSLNQSSSTALSSSSSNALYSSCMPSNILNRLLNWASPSSTATEFLVEKSRSSFVLLFLYNWALIFSLLSFWVLILNDFPFSVIVLDLLSGNLSLVLSASSAATIPPVASG